jgi:hypothetical protein
MTCAPIAVPCVGLGGLHLGAIYEAAARHAPARVDRETGSWCTSTSFSWASVGPKSAYRPRTNATASSS